MSELSTFFKHCNGVKINFYYVLQSDEICDEISTLKAKGGSFELFPFPLLTSLLQFSSIFMPGQTLPPFSPACTLAHIYKQV